MFIELALAPIKDQSIAIIYQSASMHAGAPAAVSPFFISSGEVSHTTTTHINAHKC
jgi:hypothetical protein